MEPASVCPACAIEIPAGHEFCPGCLGALHAPTSGWVVGFPAAPIAPDSPEPTSTLEPEPPLVGLVPPPLQRRIDDKLEEAALLGTLFLFLGAGVCFGYLLFHRDLLPAYGWMIAPAILLPVAIGWGVAHRLRAVEGGSTDWGDRLLFSHVRMRAPHWVIAVCVLYAIGVAVGGVAV